MFRAALISPGNLIFPVNPLNGWRVGGLRAREINLATRRLFSLLSLDLLPFFSAQKQLTYRLNEALSR